MGSILYSAIPLWLICVGSSIVGRVAMNSRNMASGDPRADWRTNKVGALVGCILAGSVYAAVLGFFIVIVTWVVVKL